MQPQTPKRSSKAPRKSTELRGFPQRPQQDATTSREKVRETVATVRAPRQTLRPVERTSKKK
jgi:hypothetical protein